MWPSTNQIPRRPQPAVPTLEPIGGSSVMTTIAAGGGGVKVVKMADVREAKGVATEREVHRGGWESEG